MNAKDTKRVLDVIRAMARASGDTPLVVREITGSGAAVGDSLSMHFDGNAIHVFVEGPYAGELISATPGPARDIANRFYPGLDWGGEKT